jgi:hypothetical protein
MAKSSARGASISDKSRHRRGGGSFMQETGSLVSGQTKIEILALTPHALWLLIRGQEFMLDFEHFPWFRRASIEDVQAVQIHFDHLYWPTLDVDLHLDSLEHPERFPLIAK